MTAGNTAPVVFVYNIVHETVYNKFIAAGRAYNVEKVDVLLPRSQNTIAFPPEIYGETW